MNSDKVNDIEDAEIVEEVVASEETPEVEQPSVISEQDKRRIHRYMEKQRRKGRTVYAASKIPFKIEHQDGKPDQEMLQLLMNLKSVPNDYKSNFLDKFATSEWKWIERRILNIVDAEEYETALTIQRMLRNQIKRDKKYVKSLRG